RLERRGGPLAERLHGLGVVVAVDAERGGAPVRGGAAPGHRRPPPPRGAARFPRLPPPANDPAPGAPRPPGGRAHVGVTAGIRGDRRDRQPLPQLAEELRGVFLDVATDIHVRDRLPTGPPPAL